jgi:hypothetical protein
MPESSVLDLANKAFVWSTITTLLLYFIIAISKGWWITKREFEAMKAEKERLEAKLDKVDLALQETAHTMHQMIGAVRNVQN